MLASGTRLKIAEDKTVMRAPGCWTPLAITFAPCWFQFRRRQQSPVEGRELDIERAAFDTDEGKRGVEELSRKLDSKQTELKALNQQRRKDFSAGMSDADRTHNSTHR